MRKYLLDIIEKINQKKTNKNTSLEIFYSNLEINVSNVLKDLGISEDRRVKDLTEEELTAIRREVAALKVEGDLRREVAMNIKRLMEIGCYRGIRHRRGLPVRGQKTKNNSRTRKNPHRTIARKKD